MVEATVPSDKNARGFHNLPVGSLISFLHEYNPVTDEIVDEPLTMEINDIARAQFVQMELYRHKTTKLITYKKMFSTQDNAYQTTLAIEKHQERINHAK